MRIRHITGVKILTDITEIEEDLKKELKKKRFRHSIGVQYTSICLAMRYGEDLEKASCAGLLHDCAKAMSGDKLLAVCRKNDLPVSPAEEVSPYLLHGRVGAYIAAQKYDVTDPDILGAITWHTTGKAAMTLLEKIVFTADYIEPGRDNAPNLKEIREMAFIDLDRAICMILKQTLDYLKEAGKPIDPATEITYNYYRPMFDED